MASMRASGLQISLIAAIAICVSSGCGGAHARYTSHLQRGQSYFASGNLDKASVEFRNAVQIEPKSAPALYFNGRVAEARNNIRAAYGFYQAALEADATHEAARAGVGKMLVFAGDAKRALEVVAPGLSAHPDNVDLLAVRAAAHQQLKEGEAARTDAERAVRLAPSNENAVAVLAAIYVQSKEYPQAITLLNAAIARAPASVQLREVLANLYLASGQPEKAQEQMRRIIELKPMELAPRSQLAAHLIRAHDLDAAQRVLEEAVEALSKGKQVASADSAKLLLVEFVSRERSREQGEKTLRAFIAREPNNYDLQLGLGALLQRTGATSEALAAYQGVVTRDGTGAKGLMARDRMAAVEVAQGHSDAARKLIAEVLQKNPRDDDALILRAGLEMQQSDPTAAIADLRAVLHDQPNSIALQRSLAAAYLAKGQAALAEETLRAAMQMAPGDVAVLIALAQVQVARGAYDETINTVQDALERDPKNAELLNLLGEVYLARKDFSHAGDLFSRASAQDPRRWQAHRNLARVKLAVNDPDAAISEYQAALKLAPAEPELVADAMRVYEKQGRIDEAIAGYEALYKGNPRMQWFAANNLAMLLVTYKKDQASLDRARDLTSGFTTSNDGSLLDTVGWVRFKRGEYQGALSTLERAAERAPDSKVIRYHLAMTQLQLGLRDRARSNLESALHGADSFQGADEARTALASLKVRA